MIDIFLLVLMFYAWYRLGYHKGEQNAYKQARQIVKEAK